MKLFEDYHSGLTETLSLHGAMTGAFLSRKLTDFP